MWFLIAAAIALAAYFLFVECRLEKPVQGTPIPQIDRATQLCLPLVEFYRMIPLAKCGICIHSESLSFEIFDVPLNRLISNFCTAEGVSFLLGSATPFTPAGEQAMADFRSYLQRMCGTSASAVLNGSLLELYPDRTGDYAVTVRLSFDVTPSIANRLMRYYEQRYGPCKDVFYNLLEQQTQ